MTTHLDDDGRPFLIREAQPSDSRAIGAILAETAAEEFILLAPDEVLQDDHRRREEIARANAEPGRCYLGVAEQGGEVVGMLDLRAVPMRRCAHVMELGIGLRRGARDRGIGTALMRHAAAVAQGVGVRKLRLFVIDGNERARRVYLREGFRETGRFEREVALAAGMRDLVVMERRVP